MGYLKTLGIVVKEITLGESDKILTVFSEAYGKISVSAKGARRQTSRFLASSQTFCYSEMELYKGRGMYNLQSCQLVEPFYQLRTDLDKLTYASHVIQIINKVIQEEQKDRESLRLLLNTLYFISSTDKNPELIARIFDLRFLVIQGFGPNIDSCLSCKRMTSSNDIEKWYFNFDENSVICNDCLKLNNFKGFPISRGSVTSLEQISFAPMSRLFNFNVSDQVLKELGVICNNLLTKNFN